MSQRRPPADAASAARARAGFHHEGLFHDGDDGFVAAVVPFLSEAVGRAEPALVAVSPRRIELLRDALGDSGRAVRFVDMRALGANPARIIPAWREFLDTHAGARVLGVGEPIWAGREEPELAECRIHEALLNTAFGAGPPWRLLCPYDVDALDGEVIAAARCTHPVVSWQGANAPSASYAPAFDALAGTLPEPTGCPLTMAFGGDGLADVRRLMIAAAEDSLPRDRAEDLVLAVNELAANSICHGGGGGVVRLWSEPHAIVCEVCDHGHLEDPLAGRVRPALERKRGRGLWMVNQLCDLVQIRSSPAHGTVVRVRVGSA